MKFLVEEKYGKVCIKGFKGILKEHELPDEYVKGPVCTFMWNDGNGVSVIDRSREMAIQLKIGKTLTASHWDVIWETILSAGMELTQLLKERGWKLNRGIAKTYET